MEIGTSVVEKKRLLKKIKGKHFAIGIICLVLIAALVFRLIIRPNLYAAKNIVTQRTANVTRGNIVNTVTGSGSIKSSNRSEISSSVTGKITKVYFEEGDSVKAGDLLLEIDDSDAKLNVQKLKNSIEQAQLTAENNSKNLNNLNIIAPFDGRVTDIIPKVGDNLAKGANVLTITDYSKLKLNVAFSEAVISDIYVGQKVTVNIEDLMQSVEGTVSRVSSKPTITSLGGVSYNVEVVIDNPGSLKDGMSANVEIQVNGRSQFSTESGELEYINSKIMTSESAGTVESINVHEDQSVRAGQLLIKLKNDDLEISSRTTDLNMEELYSQLESAERQLEDYKIYSPIDGIIVTRNVEEGDNVKPADVLFTILDPLHMEFSVPIDELDIAKIKEGQKVSITVDALKETSDRPLSGTVSKIALEGNSSNGVTTYPVTIQINETSNLRVGMNANAEIIVNEKNNVLLLPLDAVQKIGGRYYVYVKNKTDGTDAPEGNNNRRMPGEAASERQDMKNGMMPGKSRGEKADGFTAGMPVRSAGSVPGGNAGYYDNAVLTPVELGINNDDYIEVISGLNEGDEVILPALAGPGENGTQMQNGMMRGFGFSPGGGSRVNVEQRSGNAGRIRN